jgi:Flp pilus assembly protein TadG
MMRSIYRLIRSRRASMSVEFALVAPVLFIISLGASNFSMLFLAKLKLANGVTAGSQYAISYYSQNAYTLTNASSGSGTISNFQNAVQFVVAASSNFSTPLQANTATYNGGNDSSATCYCPSGSAPSWTLGSPVTCGSTCSGSVTAGKYLTIVATYSFTPVTPNPWISQQILTDSALVRLQ